MRIKHEKFELKRETFVDKIVDILEGQILSGELPPHTKLSEIKLGKEFNVSRGPAREALNRLEEMGLVEKEYSGRKVKAFDLKEYRETYELRIIIEAYSAMQGSYKASKHDHEKLKSLIEKMEKNLSPENQNLLYQLGIQFHEYLVNCSGNEKLIEVYQSAAKKVRWANSFISKLPDRHRQDFKEHLEIFRTFIKGDGKKVRRLMEDHTTRVLEIVLKKFEQKKNPK